MKILSCKGKKDGILFIDVDADHPFTAHAIEVPLFESDKKRSFYCHHITKGIILNSNHIRDKEHVHNGYSCKFDQSRSYKKSTQKSCGDNDFTTHEQKAEKLMQPCFKFFFNVTLKSRSPLFEE